VQFLKHKIPITRPFLPDEAHGGVPGRILAIAHPAPVRLVLKERAGRNAERSGQVSTAGVHCHECVELEEHSGFIENVLDGGNCAERMAPFVKRRAPLEHPPLNA
jgi:hypothetical protein